MDMFPHMAKEWKGMCAYMFSFPYLAKRYYQISLFLSIFWTFEANLRGLFMLLKRFKTLFCSKYTQKLPKTSNLLQSVRMTIVQCSIDSFRQKVPYCVDQFCYKKHPRGEKKIRMNRFYTFFFTENKHPVL